MHLNHSMIRPMLTKQTNDFVTKIATIKDFLSREECQKVIDFNKSINYRAGDVADNIKAYDSRRSEVFFLNPNSDTMWFYEKLETTITELNNAYNYDLLGFYERIQIAKYENGGKFDWHIDIGPGETSSRKLSMSIQLTDPDTYQGGDLKFMASDQIAEKAIGTLVVFPSFLQHCVTPVTRGARHSLVAWVHGNPFR